MELQHRQMLRFAYSVFLHSHFGLRHCAPLPALVKHDVFRPEAMELGEAF